MDDMGGEALFAFLQDSQSPSLQTPPRGQPLLMSAEFKVVASPLPSPASNTSSTRTPESVAAGAALATQDIAVNPKKLSFMGTSTALSRLASASSGSLDSQQTPKKEELNDLMADVSLAKKELDKTIAAEKKKAKTDGQKARAFHETGKMTTLTRL